jgi:hypothetical protein
VFQASDLSGDVKKHEAWQAETMLETMEMMKAKKKHKRVERNRASEGNTKRWRESGGTAQPGSAMKQAAQRILV